MNNFIKLDKSVLNYKILNGIIKGILIPLIIGIFPMIIILLVGNYYLFIGVFIAIVIFILLNTWFAYLDYNHAEYKIEDNAIIFKEGRFSTTTTTVSYFKIQNASYDQSFIQKMYKTGNISIIQENSFFDWKDVDEKNAKLILDKITAKSNIIPIKK